MIKLLFMEYTLTSKLFIFIAHCKEKITSLTSPITYIDYINIEIVDAIDYNLLSDFKMSRIPNGFHTRRSRWKAEELQKFIFPVAECILGDLLTPSHFHLLQLLARMTEMVYNFRSGRIIYLSSKVMFVLPVQYLWCSIF